MEKEDASITADESVNPRRNIPILSREPSASRKVELDDLCPEFPMIFDGFEQHSVLEGVRGQ